MTKYLTPLALSAAIVVALTACSGGDHKKEVQERYQSLIKDNVQLENADAAVQLKLLAQNYTQKEDSATASDDFSAFIPKYKKTIPFSFATNISYPDEKDVLGRATTSIKLKPEDLKTLGMDDEAVADVQKALPYFVITNDFLKKDELVSGYKIKPFSHDDGKITVTYEGFDLSAKLKQKNLANFPFDSKGTFKSGKFSIDDKTSYAPLDITISPLAGSFESSKKGTLHAETEPFTFVGQSAGSTETTVKANQMTLDGKDLAHDDSIKQNLGEYLFAAKDILIQHRSLPSDIELTSLSLTQAMEKDKDGLYQNSVALEVAPKTNILELFNVPNLLINNAHVSISLDKLSADALNAVNKIRNQYLEDTDTDAAEKDLIAALNKDKPEITAQLSIATDKGEAVANLNIKLTKFDEEDAENWLELLSSERPSPYLIQKVIGENLSASGNITVPKAITAAIGLDSMVQMMGGPYIKDDGSNYTAEFKIENGKLTVNGQPVR